jgi:hypothetical protein
MERKELIDIVNKIISIDGKTEAEINELVLILSKNVPHPAVSDLIYFDTLTPEEIIDKALSYKPIQL